jgi:2'-5' RNA ligase
MDNDPSILAVETPPPPTDRLFFAVFPDSETAARIAALADQWRADHALTGKPPAASRLHVTLYHLGDYVGLPEQIVEKARAAASNVAMSPLTVSFDRIASFSGRPGKQPFVLRGGEGVNALIELQRSLAISIQREGLAARAKAQFTPHVTLLYDKERIASERIEPIGWNVNEFVLVRSLLGQTTYIPLARWPLAGARPSADDYQFMTRALELARVAQAAGEVPVGAVIVKDGRVIGEGWNRPISTCDPTAHAEMVAIRAASKSIESYRLLDSTLYVTLEPCAMCAGAMVHSRIKRLVYAAADPRVGAAGSAFNVVQHESQNHRIDCLTGVLEQECSTLLRDFFQSRR